MKFEDLKIGMKESIEKRIDINDVITFSEITLDKNPIHLNEEYAQKSIFKKRVVHGMFSAGLISAVIGNKLPGEGSVYLKQDFKFIAPVFIGDIVKALVEIEKIDRERRRVTLKTECYSNNKLVLIGKAEILKLNERGAHV